MANELSTRGQTTSTTGGYVHIILPDAGSPTGFTSYRITVSNLQSALQSAINDNASDISAIDTRVTAVENINARQKFISQTSNFQFSQPSDSTVTRIFLKGAATGTNTVKIGTSALADNILKEKTLSNDADTPYIFENEIYKNAGQTLYFTIGGTVTATVYYTQDES